ncbi:polysaccharide deacetylase [Bacillus oleivorans]|uniref:Polysaccharide deacetylase n=1 Tax=Bacillus oleivorans TaxID=1448271 RepID=A0A285CID5_9BACI|nr:polysaccharide deacetylase family protein [Bacillus oleivorans]SNX67367.1 polysaccharide deacetylase [Bacillus oleivorans]
MIRQKKFFIRYLFFVFFLLGFFLFNNQVNANELRYVQVIQDTILYDDINGKQVVVGKLVKDEVFIIVSEDESYYYIKFGNHTAYFFKTDGVETDVGLTNHEIQPNSNTVIITQRPVTVFQNIGDAGGFALIGRNMRYPIIEKVGDYYRVHIGGRLGYISAKPNFVKPDPGIPVLMYHHMVENKDLHLWTGNQMVIAVEQFQEQVEYLAKHGYRTIGLSELEDYLNNEANLTGNTVVLTFDDGYLSVYQYAVPILREHGFHAVNFAIGIRIRQAAEPWDPAYLQYMGLKEMNEAGDILEHQHHTYMMHLRVKETNNPYMIEFEESAIIADLELGKIQINKSAAVNDVSEVKYLAYPWGQYDDEAISASLTSGISMAFTTEPGYVQLGMEKMKLPRQGIAQSHPFHYFIKKIEGTF